MKSPCIGVCKLLDGFCIGCGRSLQHIASWSRLSESEREKIMVSEPYRKISDNTWIATVQQDGKTKEFYLQFPDGALDQVGWDVGDTLEWFDNEDGSWTLSKKE